jgi:glycosyltransferase involved in cell wall biosynthesis
MKLLQINSADLHGSRFNGFGIGKELAGRGIDSSHLVWRRYSTDHSAELAFPNLGRRLVAERISALERKLSVQSMLHLQWFLLPLHGSFRAADAVHYHIVHDGYFSLAALPWLTWLKPSIWTLHDPWAMTGHCVHPMECARWQIGCGACPDLARPFALEKDRSALNFGYKRAVYRRLDIDVVLASRWMMEMARKSPLMRNFRLHHIPFGLDLKKFAPRPPQTARQRLGVRAGYRVICLRAFDNLYKGLDYFRQAMRMLESDKICILTTQGEGNLDEFIGRYQVIELGWTNDEALLLDSYAATDIFVMPSSAEAFGLMAIEAMACGRPVICFEGTALPEVTFAPEAGLAVPMRDAAALAAAIDRWLGNPEELHMRGRRSRELAEKYYGLELHLDRLTALYRMAVERRVAKAAA